MRNINISLVLVLTIFSVVSETHKYSTSKKRRAKFDPVEPKEDCVGIQCISPSRYPEKHIKRLIRNKKLTSQGNVFAPTVPLVMKLRSPDYENNDEGQNVCATKEVTVFPKTAKDENYKLRFIVNTNQHQQGITYETCVSKEAFINNLLLNHHFFCKQNYSSVRLLYLTEEGKLDYGKFPVPSACVCFYKIIK